MDSVTKDFKSIFCVVCADAIKAYIDTVVFLTGMVSRKPDKDNHLYRYSFYAIRDKTIISVKKLIEPDNKDRKNIRSIIKQLETTSAEVENKIPHWQENIDLMSKMYAELVNSDGAHRLQDFRNAICHCIHNGKERKIYCKDLIRVTTFSLDLLAYVYSILYDKKAHFLLETRKIAHVLAKDYWDGVCIAGRKAPLRHKMTNRLQDILDGKFEVENDK